MKKRANFPRILFFTLLVFSGSCQSTKPSSRVQHIVFIWLKEPANKIHRQQIIEVSKSFENISSVISVSAGEVIVSDRGIVDDSYDVGIVVTCFSKKAVEEYLRHPIHMKAKKEILLPLVKKVLVYDFQE